MDNSFILTTYILILNILGCEISKFFSISFHLSISIISKVGYLLSLDVNPDSDINLDRDI